jgi:hypothetical protein
LITDKQEGRPERGTANRQGHWWEPTPEATRVQQACRNAIMKIPLFPDLPVALRQAVGYGPHVDMLQHFVYWFHPRHRTMQQRWTLYKTYKEWHDKCGLSKRQVNKGRAKLGELKVIGWKRGQYGRVHYRVDWVVIAEILGLESNQTTIGGSIDELDDDFYDLDDQFNQTTIGGSIQSDHQGGPFNQTSVGGSPNTGEYAGEYLQESSPLQGGDEPAFAEPSPHEINGKEEQKRVEDQPLEDKRHSQDGGTRRESTAAREIVEETSEAHAAEGLCPPRPDDDALLEDVVDILNPDSGRWDAAEYVAKFPGVYTPEKVAERMAKGAGEISRPGAVKSARPEELREAVALVLWEAREREVG